MNCWSHRPRSSRTSHSIDKPLFIRWWPGLFVFTIWSATELNIWGRAHIWTLPISIPWLRPCARALDRRELACHWPLKSSATVFPHSSLPRSLKRKLTASAERQAWNTCSAGIQPRWAQCQCGISPSVTNTQCECHQRAGDSRASYNDGAVFATTLHWNLLF